VIRAGKGKKADFSSSIVRSQCMKSINKTSKIATEA
jgi:hypothetical protein